MKLTFFLLTVAFMQVQASGLSQTISYSGRNVPLEMVFAAIEKQTGYTFYYKMEILQHSKRLDVNLKNVTLEQALTRVFKDQPLTYNIVEKNIVVRLKEPEGPPPAATNPEPLPRIVVTGRVATEENDPLENVNITIKDADGGTTTNEYGLFEIAVPHKNAVLIFSMVGYATRTVRVAGRTFLNIRLSVSNKELDHVVVIGYGAVNKRDLTGSVSSLNFNNEVTGTSMTSLEQGLKGRMAGVLVKQTSNAPGGGISVLVRGAASISGSTEPLYVIDGFPIQGGNRAPMGEITGPANEQFENSAPQNLLNFLSPEDIESIEVLKDASATAIYGSRGANGVVLITTKKSKTTRPSFSFSHYYEVATLQRKLDLLNGYEFAKMMNEQAINSNTLDGMSYEELLNTDLLPFPGKVTSSGEYIPGPEEFKTGAYPGTDWQDQLYRTALSSNTALSFSGGAGKTKYYFGGNYRKVEGLIEGSGLERFTLNGNIQSQLYDRLSFSNNLIVSGTFMNNIQEGVANFGVGRPVITRIMQHPPTSPLGDVLEDISEGITALDDPYTMATRFIDKRQDYNVLESANIEFKITNDLVFKVRGGVRFFYQIRDMYYPLSTDRGQQVQGQANNSARTNYTLLNENTLSYNRQFGKHSINALVGFTQEKTNIRSVFSSVNGFTTDLLTFYSMQAGTIYKAPVTNYSSVKLQSFLGRVNYSLLNKYLLTFSMRADGSSKFGTDNKWAYFPSAAVGWKVSEEDFMKDISFISNLKVRASYGLTGNQGIQPYQSMAQLGPVIGTLNGSVAAIGYQNIILENPGLKWETTQQYDLGLEVSFLKNRLTVEADYYYRNTRDLLQQVLLPGSSGYVFQQQNLGAITNKGVELQVKAVLADKAFKWDISANYTKNINTITDLGDADMVPGRWVISYDFYPFKLKVGQSLGNIYGYQTNGILRNQQEVDQAPQQDNRSIGEYRLVDQNKDGQVVNDGSDEVLLGSVNPDFSFGFTTSFRYKNFDLAAIVYGSIGQEILNMNFVYGSRMVGSWNAYREVYENAFRPEVVDASGNIVQEGNPDGEWNMPGSLGARTRNIPLDIWVQDASFVKLGNVTLGYSIPRHLRFIKKLRIYASATNLLTITPYRHGYDPEASMYGQDPTRRGVDYGVYPPARTFKFGITCTF